MIGQTYKMRYLIQKLTNSFMHDINQQLKLMTEPINLQGDASFQEKNQGQEQPVALKTEDQNNKYSFSSYHMNIISGNKQVQAMPNMNMPNMCPPQNNDYMNYYMPQSCQVPQQQQFMQNDLHQLLNNMYMALNNQSKLLAYLVEKNEMNIQTTSQIYSEMTKKRQLQSETVVNVAKGPLTQTPQNSDITASDLVNILYQPKPDFKFKLIIDKDFPLEKTLYRERNFKLKINLIDDNNQMFKNSNKIPISLALYTVENPPKFLESNTLGNKMLKGYIEQDLVNGTCTFEKIQIKEVTSHYRKGMLFLVAFAKIPSFGCVSDSYFVDYNLIHPLVIDKVIVKAKRLKQTTAKQQKDISNVKDERQQSEKIVMNESDN